MGLASSVLKGATAAGAVLSTTSLVMAQGADRSGDPDIPREIAYPEPHYYIDPAGNDSASGKSEAEAWATLAPLRSVRSGTVYLKKGGSWEANLSVNGITISTYGAGDRPVVKGSASIQSKATLEGIRVDGKGRIGITISGSGNIVHDCEIDGRSGTFELGFGVMGTGNLIVGNNVHHLSAMSGDSGDMNTSGGSEAYMIMGSNNEVAYNIASEAHGINKTLGGEEGGCLEIVNGKANSIIENVYFHHNYCERSIGLFEGCSGNFQGTDKIQENHGIIKNSYVAYNLSVDAMWLYLLQPVNTDFDNLVFEHNTIVHTPANHSDFTQAARDSLGLQVNEDQGYKAEPLKPGNVIVRNNLFYVLSGGGSSMGGMGFMGALPDSDHYNNLFAGVSPGWTLGAGELKVDNPGLSDKYRLVAGSPAIDKGSTNAWQPWTDFDGNAVPIGSAPDIGASEFCDGADGDSVCKIPTEVIGTGGSSGSGGNGGGGSSVSGGAGGASSQTGNTAAGAGGRGPRGGSAGSATTGSAGASASSGPDGGQSTTTTAGGAGSAGTSSSGSGNGTGPTTGGGGGSDSTGSTSKGDGKSGETSQGSTTGSSPTNSATQNGSPVQPPEGASGCGCRLAERSPASRAGMLALLGFAGTFLGRRRRRAVTLGG